jgi:hypothetical protein
MQERSDEQLMAAMMAGDQVVLAALVTHHAPLLGYLYRLVGGDRQLVYPAIRQNGSSLSRRRRNWSHIVSGWSNISFSGIVFPRPAVTRHNPSG